MKDRFISSIDTNINIKFITQKFFLSILIFITLGSTLHGQISNSKYFVRNIYFEGNENITAYKLRKVIKLKESKLLKYVEFNRRTLKLDAITLKNYYSSEGFLFAKIEESYKIVVDDKIDVYFKIDEGIRSYLRSVSIEGNESIKTKSINKNLGLRIEKPFNFIALKQGYGWLEKEYRRLGKLNVSINENYNVANQIDFNLNIIEGPTVRIDSIYTYGLQRMDTSVVHRELQISHGIVYNEDLIETSQRRIFETGLFSIANIYPSKSQRGDEWVNISIEVREFAQKEFLSDGGVYSIQPSSAGADPKQGVGASVRWTNRNIFQSNTRFGLRATVEVPIEGATIDLPYKIPWVVRLESTLSRIWIGKLRLPTTLKLNYENISKLAFEEAQLERYWIAWNYYHKFSE